MLLLYLLGSGRFPLSEEFLFVSDVTHQNLFQLQLQASTAESTSSGNEDDILRSFFGDYNPIMAVDLDPHRGLLFVACLLFLNISRPDNRFVIHRHSLANNMTDDRVIFESTVSELCTFCR